MTSTSSTLPNSAAWSSRPATQTEAHGRRPSPPWEWRSQGSFRLWALPAILWAESLTHLFQHFNSTAMAGKTTERIWIKVGEDPIRYEYDREGGPRGPAVVDQLAYVEEEPHSAYFRWETYGEHASGTEPNRE